MAWPSASARTKNWGTEILTDADLEAQLDLLHNYFNDSLNGSTGHDHSGGTSEGPQISLTAAVTGTLPIANGGTGVTTLTALLNLVYPVGSLYFNDEVSTNPGTLLGFGTWTAITEKFIIGVGSDTAFDTAKETGGAKTVTIAQGNLPSYNLSFTRLDGNGGGLTGVQGTNNGANSTSQTVASGGSGTALSVMNPYYAAYIWRRSA
jgi:hypothetical protein